MESPKGASANNIVLVLAQDHNVCNLAYIHLPKVVSAKNLFLTLIMFANLLAFMLFLKMPGNIYLEKL